MLIHVIMHRCLSVVARQPLLPTHIETIIPIDSAESTTRSQLVARLDQMIPAPGPQRNVKLRRFFVVHLRREKTALPLPVNRASRQCGPAAGPGGSLS